MKAKNKILKEKNRKLIVKILQLILRLENCLAEPQFYLWADFCFLQDLQDYKDYFKINCKNPNINITKERPPA